MVAYTGTRQVIEIVWNLTQTNSEDNYEFSSAEKRALNTHTLYIENANVFANLRI